MGNRSKLLLRARADTTTTMLTFGLWISVRMKLLFCLTTGSSKNWSLFLMLTLFIVILMGPVMLLESDKSEILKVQGRGDTDTHLNRLVWVDQQGLRDSP